MFTVALMSLPAATLAAPISPASRIDPFGPECSAAYNCSQAKVCKDSSGREYTAEEKRQMAIWYASNCGLAGWLKQNPPKLVLR